MKKTIVLGASEDPDRYASIAITRLKGKGHEAIAVGLTSGTIHGLKIHTKENSFDDVDTITMYVGPRNQPYWYDFIISQKPKRIIFNPGAENPELVELANKNGIETMNACTLVMLSIGNY
jgi:uncharacterized protein